MSDARIVDMNTFTPRERLLIVAICLGSALLYGSIIKAVVL